MRVLLLTSHSIAEYDDLRMLSDLGYDVFSIGAYTDPADPADDKRPALPGVAAHPDLAALCVEQRERYGEPGPYIDWAKAILHPAIVEWAETIIVHHYPERWIVPQWPSIRHKRVIWRTCGQSSPPLEAYMRRLRDDGLGIVRYSPAERRAYEPTGSFAGEDAVIRFGKYPADWTDWNGEDAVVGNVTQDMIGRADACGLSFWQAATDGLPARPAGPRSELLPGGVGALAYDEMRDYLRRCRAYLYTGTEPASYTLGLIEALMTGVPVVAMSAGNANTPALYEAAELAPITAASPREAHATLRDLLAEPDHAASAVARAQALALFDVATVGDQWRDHLDAGVSNVERRLAGRVA